MRLARATPALAHASVAMTAGPPAFVTMARPVPQGTGWCANASDMPKSSSVSRARRTPAAANAASYAASDPARLPVWDETARAPASDAPALSRTIGVVRTHSRAVRTNRGPSTIDSR